MPNKIIQQDKYPRKSIENYMEKDIKLAKAIEEAFARLYIYMIDNLYQVDPKNIMILLV